MDDDKTKINPAGAPQKTSEQPAPKDKTKTLTNTLQLSLAKQKERVQQSKKKADHLFHSYVTSVQRADNFENVYVGEYKRLPLRIIWNALGQTLYRIGEQTEYGVRCFFRFLCFAWHNTLGLVLGLAWQIVKNLAVSFWHFIAEVTNDLTLPLRQLFHALRHIKERKNQTVWQYLATGIRNNRTTVKNALMYLFPVCTGVLCVLTISIIMKYNFALAVTYNDELIGFVQNENVWDEALTIVQNRISSAETDRQFSAFPTLRLAICDKDAMLGKSAMADTIISKSSDEIQQATGIFVNGSLIGVTADGVALQDRLNALLEEYKDPANTSIRPEFANKIDFDSGVYYTSSVLTLDGLLQKLGAGGDTNREVYTLTATDKDAGLIAAAYGLTLDELYTLNPQMTQEGYTMAAGDKLLVSKSDNLLQVQTVETTYEDQVIPYETVREETDTLTKGVTKVIQYGEDGMQNLCVEVVRINGVEVARNIIAENSVVTKEAVPRIIQVGTKAPVISGGGSSVVGNGGILPIPVPNYVRYGTYAGHRGIDFMAPYGSPIYACDSGTVITAMNGAGTSYWSYGNFVVIDHGNGMRTVYAHCSSLGVSAGQVVSAGQYIGAVGDTGRAAGYHCHVEVQINGAPQYYGTYAYFGISGQ